MQDSSFFLDYPATGAYFYDYYHKSQTSFRLHQIHFDISPKTHYIETTEPLIKKPVDFSYSIIGKNDAITGIYLHETEQNWFFRYLNDWQRSISAEK